MISLNDKKLLRQQVWINGQWADAESGKTIAVTNPADGSVLGSVPAISKAEVRDAIDAADKAFVDWRRRPAKERSGILQRWYQLVMDHQADLAVILTSEQGKPLAEAKGEIAYAAAFIQWFAEEAKRVYGDTIPAASADQRIFVIRQPVACVQPSHPGIFRRP